MNDARWYVVRTRSHSEHIAADDLSRNGFEVFSPRIKNMDSLSGNRREPLFPGYLFLRCDLRGDLPSLLKTTHRVVGWLKFDGDIAWVPDQVIDEIKDRSEAINREGGIRQRFNPGDMVQIKSGAIQGLAKVIDDNKSIQSKVRILLNFMGRPVMTEISGAALHPIDDSSWTTRRPKRRTRGKQRWIRTSEPTH